MKKYEQPKRAVTEITITNVKEVHEGRVDAIFEFHDGRYGLIDWKTNDINKATGGGTDKWQLIANFLLANYRYTGEENNWSRCFFFDNL
jgi:ATP-dependent exoDNAse (exonuclease V) beta subunit